MHRLRACLIVLAMLVAAGCSSGGDSPAGGGDARVVATTEFGRIGLLDVPAPSGGPLLRTTAGLIDVETSYGGDFLSSLAGRRSDAAGRRDWFWYVNGLLGDESANGYDLRPGDTGWWDHRSWEGQMDVFAVVGLWPEPFVHGYGGARPRVSADAPLRDALTAAGATTTGGDGSAPWRVRVGSDADLRRRDPVWARAMADPARAGAAGAIRGGRVTLLAPGGDPHEPIPNARAVAVALRTGDRPGEGMLLAVAGVDAAAARAAARTIAARPAVLQLRYAVAFDGDGAPLRAAGRGTP